MTGLIFQFSLVKTDLITKDPVIKECWFLLIDVGFLLSLKSIKDVSKIRLESSVKQCSAECTIK